MLRRIALLPPRGSWAPVVVILLTLSVINCGGIVRTQHGEAIHIIEKHWRTDLHWWVLPIGQVEIVKSDWKIDKGQTSPGSLKAYQVLQRQNAIAISSNTDLTSSNQFSWDNFIDLSQRGVVRKLTVTLTAPQDNKLACPDSQKKSHGTENIICVDSGSGSILEVVRSQKFQIGTRLHWFVMGNHRWKLTDTARQIWQAVGTQFDENRKFMVILRYDDFDKQWRMMKEDYAARSGWFEKQQEFDQFLTSARIEGSPVQ